MTKSGFTGQLRIFIDKAESGKALDIYYLMNKLSDKSSLADTKFIDFALVLVTSYEGFDRIN
jgi:hypothetical protein